MTQFDHDPFPPRGVDLSRPSVARVYDWVLGGTTNWAIDREFGEKVLATFPMARPIAMANRLFLHRVVRHLVRAGVRQFIDLGAGVPTMGSTHQVADELVPDSRVVYVDNEPVAVAHSQVLLDQYGDPARHRAVHGDLRNPESVWQRVIESGVIDLEQPVALLMIAVLHIRQAGPDGTDIGARVTARYRELLSPGSYLAISHYCPDEASPEVYDAVTKVLSAYDKTVAPVTARSQAEIGALFGDFDLVEPGLAWVPDWHPEESGAEAPRIEFDVPGDSLIYVGAGRKS